MVMALFLGCLPSEESVSTKVGYVELCNNADVKLIAEVRLYYSISIIVASQILFQLIDFLLLNLNKSCGHGCVLWFHFIL